MTSVIRPTTDEHRAEWLRLRRALWEDRPDPQHLREMAEIEASAIEDVFAVVRPEGGLGGFLEVSIRPWAIGCEPHPVGYIEGWYVDEDLRQQGVGRRLVEAAEAWARSRGCRQMASDAELWNTISQQAHGALGYAEVGRLVLFRKDLSP